MDAYRIFSKFYDQYIQDTAPLLHKKYFDLVLETVKRFQIETTRILDASCGTGTLAKMLSDEHYNIEGADLSEDMLKYANKKGIKTYRKDICKLDIDRKYDIILCFDTLGHILGNDNLRKALLSISNCLNPNGVFICDGGTRKKAQRMVGQTYHYESEEYHLTWINKEQNGHVKVHFRILEKTSGIHYNASFLLEGHDIEDMVVAATPTDLEIIYATLEPIVKLEGSFIMCLRKNK